MLLQEFFHVDHVVVERGLGFLLGGGDGGDQAVGFAHHAHAASSATTGRFDDEQLFYLMSRGITLENARRLVVRGFFNEIITEIGNEEVQERLMERIDGELERAGA